MRSSYPILQAIFRIALKTYFEKVEIEGIEKVSAEGPFLVIVNHQNAFLDAFLMGAFFPKPLYFLTRSDVFKWWSRPLFKLVNMIPIYRIRDGYSSLSENEQIFQACQELFKKKKSILIFAEGNHGEHHFLRPLSKGAARLALQSTHQSSELRVLPAGLNYFHHREPNSKVLLVFGRPFGLSSFRPEYEHNKAIGIRKLRDKMEKEMKTTLVIPEAVESYGELKRHVFRKENESLTFSELRQVAVSEEILKEPPKPTYWLAKVLNPLPYLVSWLVLLRIKDVVFHSSTKFALGSILFPIWWIVSFFILNEYLGIIQVLVVVLLMILSIPISYKWLK